jgi:ferredoxin-NADP reductase
MLNTGIELDLIVVSIRRLTPAVKEFQLAAADGSRLPGFQAGAHLRFFLPVNANTTLERPLERHYSLINAACQDGTYRIAVSRAAAGSGGSAYMSDQVAPGTRLRALGPLNTFPLATGASRHLLLAGGIGITPLLAMASALDAAGQPFELHYVARQRELMACHDEVSWLGDRAKIYFDHGDPASGLPLAKLLSRAEAGVHVYACGPQPMIDAVIGRCKTQGWPGAQVHFELFDAPPARSDDDVIEVTLSRSQRELRVKPDQSILDALLDAGMNPLHDCRRGECGVCAVSVIEGVPDHRDYALTEQEKTSGKKMCICVSRSTTRRLVLDI